MFCKNSVSTLRLLKRTAIIGLPPSDIQWQVGSKKANVAYLCVNMCHDEFIMLSIQYTKSN